jgi:hypothetical protein
VATATAIPPQLSDSILSALERDGVVVLPELMSNQELGDMRAVFESRLKHLRWSDVDGYERTELYRHMVQDVLTLHQGFVDIGLHPLVKDVLNRYIGTRYELCEAKGWKSLATKSDFHGWHGDAWYDQTRVTDRIPREVKLAFYLTDVETGFFQYIKGSHRKHAPRGVRTQEVADTPPSQVFEAKGKAGTAFLFDTSGIHRQSAPILEERLACFYNYHDPDVALQKEDLDYYRYHPLLLNAAFLGNLSKEDERILGFGNKTNYIFNFERKQRHPKFQRTMELAFAAKLRWDDFSGRVVGKVRKILG